MTRWTPAWVLVLAAVATPVLAQTSPASEGSVRPNRFELGGGFGMVSFLGEGSKLFPTAQARLNLWPSVAAEVAAHFGSGAGSGFYDLRGRITQFPTARVSPYFMFGGLGEFEIGSVHEFRNTLPTGDVVVHPGYTYHRLSAPIALTGGGGACVRFGRVSLDAGAEVWVFHEGVAVAMRTVLMVGLGPRR